MSTTTKQTGPNRRADWVAGFNDPSMGDEREREVILRAYTYAMQLSLYCSLAIAVVFAAVGAGWWSAVPLVAMILPTAAAARYARREGVDLAQLTESASAKRRNWALLVSILAVACWAAALAYHQLVGHPLFRVSFGTFGGDDSPSSSIGLIVGAGVGVAGGVAAQRLLAVRRRRRMRAEEAAQLDGDE